MAGAVFLSYASQDAEAALRLCEALRAAGAEVWFDQSELRGGDAWDAKIRKQIRDCAIFVPLISANTQSRPEGYFRLEWHLAEQRSHLIARGRPFIVPVAIDRTNDAEALVPDVFLEVQWTRVPGGEASPAFCERVKKLLGGESAEPERSIPLVAPKTRSGDSSPPRKKAEVGLAPWVVGVAAILVLLFWRPWRKAGQTPPASPMPAFSPPAAPPSEARQLVARARGLFGVLDATRDDFKLAEDLLSQAQAKDAADPEVLAAVAQLDQWYSLRGWDTSDARRDAARTAAQRALRLDPQSFEVQLAQVGLLDDFGHEGLEKEKLLRQLRQERPDDQRVLRTLAITVDRQGHVDEADALLDESAALPGGDPLALYDKSLNLWFVGRTAEAEAAIHAAIAQKPFGGALLINCWYQTVLHGDLAGARSTLDRIPSIDLQEDRAAFFAYYVDYLRRDADAALGRLQAVPRDWLHDAWYTGPKGRLIGDALHLGGRDDAAATVWRAALKLVDTQLEAQPANRGLLINQSILLADLGERAEAGRQFSLLLQIAGTKPAGVAWTPRWVTEICIALDRKAEAIQQIANSLKSERHAVDYTTAILRLDPEFDSLRGEPAFQKLIVEAQALEQASSQPPSAKAP